MIKDWNTMDYPNTHIKIEIAPLSSEAICTAYGIPCLTASRRQGTRITTKMLSQPYFTGCSF